MDNKYVIDNFNETFSEWLDSVIKLCGPKNFYDRIVLDAQKLNIDLHNFDGNIIKEIIKVILTDIYKHKIN